MSRFCTKCVLLGPIQDNNNIDMEKVRERENERVIDFRIEYLNLSKASSNISKFKNSAKD